MTHVLTSEHVNAKIYSGLSNEDFETAITKIFIIAEQDIAKELNKIDVRKTNIFNFFKKFIKDFITKLQGNSELNDFDARLRYFTEIFK